MPTTISTTSWFAKRILLALPLAVLLFSCEEPTDIGLAPDSQVGVQYIDLPAIEAKTVFLDSIITTGTSSSLTSHIAGQMQDSEFGHVKAVTYSELRLKDVGYSVGTSITDVTVTLQLNYLGAYGEKDQRLKLGVHRLYNNIEGDQQYNFSSVAYEQDPVGVIDIVPSEIVLSNKKRTFISAELNPAFGEELLALSSGSFADQNAFRQAVRGIAIAPLEGNSVASFGFERDADTSYVRIDYRANGEARTLKLYLDRAAKRFHSITADRTGSTLGALAASGDMTEPIAGATYIQSGTGLRTVLKFPNLENLRETIGSEIAINDAHLIIPVTGSDTATFTPINSLFIAKSSGYRPYFLNNVIQLISLDNKLIAAPYNRKTGEYVARIGSYLQKVLYGNEENRGIMLYSVANSSQVSRVRLQEPGTNGIRLRIYYTKVQ